jgi:hypothetical protein
MRHSSEWRGLSKTRQKRENAGFINWNPTYESNGLAKNHGGGKLMNDREYILKQCHELIVVSSKLTEGLCFFLNGLSKGVNRVAAFESDGERMLEEI